MIKPFAIIAGEPNSISSEIIFKSWNLKKKYKHKPFFIIGNIRLLNLQLKKLKYKIKIKNINNNLKINNLYGNELPVYNVDFNQKKAFEKISTKSNKYILKCFETALNLISSKKIIGFINCPVSKETLFKKKHQGITEFLSKKYGAAGNEVMLIYNKELAVSPVTTHIPIDHVSKQINENKIINKVKIINNFYKKKFKKKPHFAILGLNPHNSSHFKVNDKRKFIIKAVNKLIKFKVKVSGPISPDSSFVDFKRKNYDIIIGMYHDQVLSPFKALYNYKAINITLGLPFLRISPDHGVGEDIVGKKKANPESLIESIKFFNKLN